MNEYNFIVAHVNKKGILFPYSYNSMEVHYGNSGYATTVLKQAKLEFPNKKWDVYDIFLD